MCAATLRLSHQKVEIHTSRKKGVIIMEVTAIVIQARIEYAFNRKDLMSSN
jgi:hypothetical protein